MEPDLTPEQRSIVDRIKEQITAALEAQFITMTAPQISLTYAGIPIIIGDEHMYAQYTLRDRLRVYYNEA